MKKIRLFLISMIFTTLALTSCNFSYLFTNKVKSIDIKDNHGQYQIGDVYKNENELFISAKYTDGSIKTLSSSEAGLTIDLFQTIDNIKTHFSYDKAFAVEGNYSVQVTYEDVSSNVFDIEVIKEHKYATSISLTGPDKLENKQTISLTVEVSPSDYTSELVYTVSDGAKSLVDLTPTASGVDVTARKTGELDVIVTTQSSKTSTISATHHLTIEGTTSTVDLQQDYNDLVKNSAYNISATPLSGNPKLLVIPVWFTDSFKYITNNDHKQTVKEDIEKAYFGSKEATGWESVSSYYEEESQGRLRLTGTVSDWYNCGYSSEYVGGLKSSSTEFKSIVKNATDWFFNNNLGENRADYDSDNDSILDGVMLIYAAPDYGALKDDNLSNLWAYCFWLQETMPGQIYPNAFFWASYDFMYGNNIAKTKTGSTYHSGYTKYVNVDAHTYIHEMGHMFGLEDYYDYSGQYKPAGGFSMQDYNIGGHDPFSVMSLGWASPYIPDSSMEITIDSFSDYYDLILLTPEFNGYLSPFDEYLLIELYTPTSLNEMDIEHRYMGDASEYPTGSDEAGIRLWHVDARLAKNVSPQEWEYTSSSDVKQGRVRTAFTNTSNDGKVDKNYLSVLGSDYYDNNLLQLIRNYDSATDKMNTTFTSVDLFTKGSTFSMANFSKQFVNGTKLNNGLDLGWTFTVKDIVTDVAGHSSATIQLTRV